MTPEKSLRKRDSNPGTSALETNALTTRPTSGERARDRIKNCRRAKGDWKPFTTSMSTWLMKHFYSNTRSCCSLQGNQPLTPAVMSVWTDKSIETQYHCNPRLELPRAFCMTTYLCQKVYQTVYCFQMTLFLSRSLLWCRYTSEIMCWSQSVVHLLRDLFLLSESVPFIISFRFLLTYKLSLPTLTPFRYASDINNTRWQKQCKKKRPLQIVPNKWIPVFVFSAAVYLFCFSFQKNRQQTAQRCGTVTHDFRSLQIC